MVRNGVTVVTCARFPFPGNTIGNPFQTLNSAATGQSVLKICTPHNFENTGDMNVRWQQQKKSTLKCVSP